ncbi:MAG TPA: Mut7-C RNAse domain-containing protein [Desulfosalsimonadaceae bacterium]|nr:Mut7-C RNAse domain-containing protein [Desulfosalsimonadaceae bacterium]
MGPKISIMVRAYEELNTYLPTEFRKRDFPVKLKAGASVRSLLSQLHIPENQVDLILVNGRSADLDRLLENRDRIAIYPVFESLDISDVSRIDRSPLRRPKFIADQDLNELTDGLRSLGFDVRSISRETWEEDVDRLNQDTWILLTKDSGVAAENAFERVLLIKSTDPKDQLKEVVERLDLQSAMISPPS